MSAVSYCLPVTIVDLLSRIWRPTQFHPLLPRYALARMEKEAMIKLSYDISIDMGELEWIGFLGRLRDLCNVGAGAQRVSEDDYRLTRLAIFDLVQVALHNRFRTKKVKAA